MNKSTKYCSNGFSGVDFELFVFL
uniref:Uncharacterized protein n=1 Tax=Anguilla anguilla TaxID=7936 RepID=A0A0E9XCJ1_ANGAN